MKTKLLCITQRIVLSVVLAFSILACGYTAAAYDVKDARVKLLYDEAERLSEAGEYSGAIKKYTKAIRLAADKDVKDYLKAAREEARKKNKESKKCRKQSKK